LNYDGYQTDDRCESPLTSLPPTPTLSPTPTIAELPIHSPEPRPDRIIPESAVNLDAGGTWEQRQPGNATQEYKRKSSKIRKARKRASEKTYSKVTCKLQEVELRHSVEQRFVGDAEPLEMEIDASDFPAASTGYVGIGGQPLKTPIKLESIGKKHGTKGFRIVKWNDR
jgi:hypothetical protein